MKWAVAFALVALCCTSAVRADDPKPLHGVALVIGESKYIRLPKLPNPAGDARAIDDMLGGLGFDVDRLVDGRSAQIEQRLDEFVSTAGSADVAVVYYAGHGVEIGGKNYIMGTDADISSNATAEQSLIPVDDLIDRLQKVAPITIVLLDACRTSPFPNGKSLKLDGMAAAAPVGSSGLAVIVRGPSPVAANASASDTNGTVIGFAASPGQAALDGDKGQDSPYAAALLKHLVASGYSFGDVMTMVSEEVYVTTHAKQLPWTNSSLNRILYFGSDPAAPTGDAATILDDRRKLLLRIATAPDASRQVVENVAHDNNIDLAQLYSMLDVINGSKGDLTDANEDDLRNIAGHLREVLDDPLLPATPTDPELARLDGLAKDAIAQGDVARAYQYRKQEADRAGAIEKGLDSQQAQIDQTRKELAGVYARVAETAIMNQDGKGEGEQYKRAAEQVDTFDKALSFKLRLRSADAYARLALQHGKLDAANTAIELYRDLLKEADPKKQAAISATMQIQISRLSQQVMWEAHDDGAANTARDAAIAANTYFSAKRSRRDWLDGLEAQAKVIEYFRQPLNLAAAFYQQGLKAISATSDPMYFAIFNWDLAQIHEKTGDLKSAQQEYKNEALGYHNSGWLGGEIEGRLGYAKMSLHLAIQSHNDKAAKAALSAGKDAFDLLRQSMQPNHDTEYTYAKAEELLVKAGIYLNDIDTVMTGLNSYARTRDLWNGHDQGYDFALRAKAMADGYLYAGQQKKDAKLLQQAKAEYTAAQEVFEDHGDKDNSITSQLAEIDTLLATLSNG